MRTLPDKIIELTLPSGAKVNVDANGYLTDQHDWTPEFTQYRAEVEGITLTPLHHEILKFIRDSEEEKGVMPDVRFVFKYLAKRALFGLFQGAVSKDVASRAWRKVKPVGRRGAPAALRMRTLCG